VRFGVSLPNFGTGLDAAAVADLARAAETAGWDGFFLWDHLLFSRTAPVAVADVWTLLAAAACSTERILLGPMVAAVPRRAPWDLARQCVTLDRLSKGRLILGVGLGSPPDADFEAFGLPSDLLSRAGRLDETLELVASLWSGEETSYEGRYVRVDNVTFLPTPHQPSIPIWVAVTAKRKRPVERAARCDGAVPLGSDLGCPTLQWFEDLAQELGTARGGPGLDGYDLVALGSTFGLERDAAAAHVAAFERAGARWWMEMFDPFRHHVADVRDHASLGPPRLVAGAAS
jgi:alkanesulfonate monooxygenase SsuD/methylene tetrahydromethanopterin reductase-like flavin-dependent oxidoreductase (luciferase family)